MKPRRTKEFILAEIRRLASASPGTPVGITRFTKETGIKRTAWEGVFWTAWSDALREAGVRTNTLNQPYPEEELLRKLADLTRDLGRMPAKNHLKFAWKNGKDFPAPNTFYSRFGTQAEMVDALRRWVEGRAEYGDVAAVLPAQRASTSPVAVIDTRQVTALSSSFVPSIVAGLPSLARMEEAQPIEFEERVATAFEVLGLEVQRLGQGSGREPDGIARCRQDGWAVIYDAKARAGSYRILAPEERKFLEYIERYAPVLRKEGMKRTYFAVISSAFNEGDLPRAAQLAQATDAKAVSLVEATALVKAVEQHIVSPLKFTLQHLERAFTTTRIVRERDIGDGEPLRVVSAPDVVPGRGDGAAPDEAHATFDVLMARWPDFEARVYALVEFFDYTKTRCLASPLQSNDGLDVSKPEDAALNGRREAALSALGLMNHLTWQLGADIKRRPQSLNAAEAIVVRFRTLISAPAILQLDALYQALAARSPRAQEFTERMARFESFKLDYESFARVANQHLGVEFFRPYVA